MGKKHKWGFAQTKRYEQIPRDWILGRLPNWSDQPNDRICGGKSWRTNQERKVIVGGEHRRGKVENTTSPGRNRGWDGLVGREAKSKARGRFFSSKKGKE